MDQTVYLVHEEALRLPFLEGLPFLRLYQVHLNNTLPPATPAAPIFRHASTFSSLQCVTTATSTVARRSSRNAFLMPLQNNKNYFQKRHITPIFPLFLFSVHLCYVGDKPTSVASIREKAFLQYFTFKTSLTRLRVKFDGRAHIVQNSDGVKREDGLQRAHEVNRANGVQSG